MNDWTLSKKLLVAFSVIGALLAALAMTGGMANRELSSMGDRHVARGLAGVTALSELLNLAREERIIVLSHATTRSSAAATQLEEQFAKANVDLVAKLDAYAKISGEDLEEDAAKLRALAVSLIDVNTRILASKREQPDATQALIEGDGREASDAMIAQADLLQRKTLERSEAASVEGHSYANSALGWMIALAIISVAGMGYIWFLLSKTVSNPMAELAGVTTKLANGANIAVPHRDRGDELGAIAKAVEQFRDSSAQRAIVEARDAAEQQTVTTALGEALQALTGGDLTAQITADFPPAYAALKHDYNSALSSLCELIGGVTESADGIRTGSQEIAQASEDLARRTEGNAASLEQTSAALVQIDTRLKATAQASGQTVGRADQAISTVGGGRATAEEAVAAMGRVSDSAKGIDSVIEGLDKIAFQTRVLAMNAAVEAGRAGDAGRGFAVVADLVSALAMRAEEEAKRARDQLTLTQTDIVTAVQAVQKVDGALANISSDVGEVHKLLGTMAEDATAQSSAISQISVAISAMDQSTQQNAAMVEQTSAAARNLTTEVTSLSDQTGKFRISGAAPVRRARASAPALPAPSKPSAPRKAASAYKSPVKALPAMASVDTGGSDDWNAF
nr:methyl-accepting chemotaxis protein [Sphingomonas sp. 37zxx]